jgi:hypothetical protein
LTVKAANELFGDRTLRELDEREAARSTRVPINGQRHLRGLADRGEVLAQLALAHAVI